MDLRTPPGSIPVTTARAAELFGVSENTVGSWIRAGLPVLKRGSKGAGKTSVLDLAILIPWYLEENALDVAKTRLASAQADKTEMDNAARRGELLEVSTVEREWTDLVLSFRAKARTIPTKLAPQLTNVADSNAIAERLRIEIDGALSELADQTSRPRVDRGSEAESREASRAPAKVNGGRMGGRAT